MFSSTVALFLLALSAPATAVFSPITQRCPANFELVRRGQSISGGEARYIQHKRERVLPDAFKAYLKNVKRTGVTLPRYVEKILERKEHLPTVGISTSGGGYRAAIFGAGVLNALDGRNSSSAKKGTGGLLQATTHIAGLSGGSWLITSLAQANFPTIQHLIFGDGKAQDFSGWIPNFDFFRVSSDPTVQNAYAQQLLQEISGKAKHFPVSIGDVWGRLLARHFTNGTTPETFLDSTSHGAGILFSGLVNLPTFASHAQPFPIVTLDLVSKHINGSIFPGGNQLPLNTPQFEVNPVEMGCYDEVLAAHTPTKHLGTTNKSACVTGFDESMFISGASSNIWLQANITAQIFAGATANLSTLLNITYPQPATLRLDTSNFPNPFFGVAPKTFADSGETILAMCDGGFDGQVTPLQPMLVKEREIDVVIAVDAANDSGDGYARGASLIATQERMKIFPRGLAAFPRVPSSVEGFLARNLTTRPAFFGCTPSYVQGHAPGPLVVYIANGGPPRNGAAPLTNTSTTQTIYPESQLQGMLQQTFDVATQGMPSRGSDALVDREWGACLACAVVDRARARDGVKRSGVCESCFTRYCWEG